MSQCLLIFFSESKHKQTYNNHIKKYIRRHITEIKFKLKELPFAGSYYIPDKVSLSLSQNIYSHVHLKGITFR